MTTRHFTFTGGERGPWRVASQRAIVDEPLPPATRIHIQPATESFLAGAWQLRGITSNERYVERGEREQLVRVQEGLGRPQASLAVLIPIRKSAAWWAMTQDERRAVIEVQSRHIQIGMKYLPSIARRLHHCRDLSESEPFDFLTWFEFAPDHAAAFDELLAELRATPEWAFVEREVEIRVELDARNA
jgi:chlorite dismutase